MCVVLGTELRASAYFVYTLLLIYIPALYGDLMKN
jgi:hypothetical protein